MAQRTHTYMWKRPSIVQRKDYIQSTQYDDFIPFVPSYEKEKETIWKIMTNEYQRQWERERDALLSEYWYYKLEKKAQLGRAYVPKMLYHKAREDNRNKKVERYIHPRFIGIKGRVYSSLPQWRKKTSAAEKASEPEDSKEKPDDAVCICASESLPPGTHVCKCVKAREEKPVDK